MEDGGDLGDAELVDGGEQQGVALGFGEALDFAEGGGDLAGVGEGLVGGDGVGDEGFGEGFVELVGTDAAAAIDGQVPGDADQPDAEVADFGELQTDVRGRAGRRPGLRLRIQPGCAGWSGRRGRAARSRSGRARSGRSPL